MVGVEGRITYQCLEKTADLVCIFTFCRVRVDSGEKGTLVSPCFNGRHENKTEEDISDYSASDNRYS